ncbi:unnamed protein product [Effrenium voratum]|nr:unnamed protein product [Effrenium voratum]
MNRLGRKRDKAGKSDFGLNVILNKAPVLRSKKIREEEPEKEEPGQSPGPPPGAGAKAEAPAEAGD